MGLYKRKNVWWMDFVYRGKQVRKSTKTNNKSLAEKIYCKLVTQIQERKWFERLPGEEKTFRELMEKYLREYSATNKALTSHIRDKSLADHLKKYFGDLTVVEITPKSISEYKTIRRNEKSAPKTINNELALMSHAYNLAIKEWEWVRENPVKRVSKEKVNNQIERWLTFEEEEKLLAVSPVWLQEITIFAIHTGLRRGEILNLKWPQVDLFRKTITILEQKNKNKDTLPLNQNALAVLKRRAKIKSITHFVFYNGNVQRIDPNNLNRAFRSAVKKSGIEKLRFHDLRHTFATRLIQGGIDLYKLQRLGRWKDISMVMRYAHHYPESLRSGIEILDKVQSDSITNLSHPNEKGATANTVTP
ncbi:MAG: tyrosine-type recombinase/integrase [Nitrospiria bacterium]